jgi:hypothetical protein
MELRRRRPLMLAAAVAVAAVSLLAAGCGGGGSARLASVASPTTAATAAPQNGLVAYAACMRSNGVPNFPDPTGAAGIPKQAVVAAFQAVGTSRAAAASNACRHVLGAGGSLGGKAAQPIDAQDRQDYLEAAACMRSHGFPGFPDPTFQNNSVQLAIPSSIDQDSARFKTAATACVKLIPAGLPYTRPSGQ